MRVIPCLALVLALLAGACGGSPDAAPAVASPSLTLNQTDAAVGSPVDMTFAFAVAPDAPPFAEDYWVFVHFLDADGELMWTDDHQPATPTRQWKSGAAVEYTRTMFVPKFPYNGETRVEVGLFSPKTGERLPLTGNDQGMRSYQVATFNLRLQTDNVFVVFGTGWHETEVGDATSGLEWQWSRGLATMSFRNPGRDATVFLQLDQPVRALPDSQMVEVRVGTAVLDRFALPAGERVLRRIPVTAAQLGAGETVEMALAVDKTFVPATVPALRSGDPRELGVRVFRVFVQPG